MRRQLTISQKAKDDLTTAWLYIAADSLEAADRWLEGVYDTLAPLCDHPHLGRQRPELAPDLRSLVHQNHVLFYLPSETEVRLIRVLHGARDIGQGDF